MRCIVIIDYSDTGMGLDIKTITQLTAMETLQMSKTGIAPKSDAKVLADIVIKAIKDVVSDKDGKQCLH